MSDKVRLSLAAAAGRPRAKSRYEASPQPALTRKLHQAESIKATKGSAHLTIGIGSWVEAGGGSMTKRLTSFYDRSVDYAELARNVPSLSPLYVWSSSSSLSASQTS